MEMSYFSPELIHFFKKLDRALHGKAFKSLFRKLHGEKNKRLDRSFAAAVEQQPVIAYKQFYYYAEYRNPSLLLRKDLAQFVMNHSRAGSKVNEFLKAALGQPSPG